MRYTALILGFIIICSSIPITLSSNNINSKKNNIIGQVEYWSRVVIDNSLDGSHNVLIENIDTDNKPDIVSCGYRDEIVVWYQQPEDPINDSWIKYTIDPFLPNAHDIQIGDIDGDGNKDIVGLSLSEDWQNYNLGNGSVVWYKKTDNPTNPWIKTTIASSGNTGLLGARSSGLGDIDSDGDLDIAVAIDTHKYPSAQGRIFWYQNPGGILALNPSLWNEFLIDDTVGTGADAQIGDIDKDGNPDIVYSGNYGNPMGTFIYFAPQNPIIVDDWARISVAGDSYHVHIIDFDYDGNLDILRASAFQDLISWLENPYPIDPRNPSNWNEYIIEQNPSIHIANRVSTADIDDDGDLDVGMNANPTYTSGVFKWYRRPDNPTDFNSYEIYTIDNNPTYTSWAHDSCFGDIDIDGDIDMCGVGPNAQSGTVLLWINEVNPPQIYNVNAIPFKQSIGGNVNISAEIIDDVGLDEVFLKIRYPDYHWESISIIQNKSKDIYFCNMTYDFPGTYLCSILAIDTDNNQINSTSIFFIISNEFLVDCNGPYYGYVNHPVKFTGNVINGVPPYNWHWEFGDGLESNEQNPIHSYDFAGNFSLILSVEDAEDNNVEDYSWATIVDLPVLEPPEIYGPINGKPDILYDFNFWENNLDDDKSFFIDWGDGTFTDWSTYYSCGEIYHANHTWKDEGKIIIKAKVKNIYGIESEWGTWDFSVPRTRTWLRSLDMFPILERILNIII